MKRLAIITSHPIQYNAPLFKLLSSRNIIGVKVFYTWSQSKEGYIYDPGFGKRINWDIPLLQGYDYTFVHNTAKNPGTHQFYGIVNPTLIKEVEQWQPDALLVFGWAFNSHLKVLRYFHKKVFILFRGDSTLLGENLGVRLVLRTMLLKWVYKHIDYALHVGTNNKKYYLRHGVKEHQLFFAPHAIDNNRFSDESDFFQNEALLWRKQLHICSKSIVFLFAGKLEPKKNAEFLIQTFLKLQSKCVHLIIVGNGLMEKNLKQKYSGISNISFIDFQNQTKMPIVYRLSDVFVLPSKGHAETWGLSINEAMACARAVLVSDRCGGAIDLVKNGINGFIYSNDDKRDLLNKMKELILSKESVRKMGDRSLEIIQKSTFEDICIQIENLLLRK